MNDKRFNNSKYTRNLGKVQIYTFFDKKKRTNQFPLDLYAFF